MNEWLTEFGMFVAQLLTLVVILRKPVFKVVPSLLWRFREV